MKSQILPIVFAALGTTGHSVAQAPSPTPIPPPEPPFVAEPRPGTTYGITVKYEDAPQASDGGTAQAQKPVPKTDRPVAVVVKLDAKSRQITVNHANGAVSEGYLFDSGFVIRSTANSEKTFVSAAAKGASALMEMFTKDFQGTQWIERAHYKGVEKLDGVDCYVFFRAAEPMPTFQGDGPPPGYDPLKYEDLKAFIRVADKTPALVQLGPASYHYSPVQPWNGTIALPDNFKSSAEEFTKQLAVIEALRQKKKREEAARQGSQ